jgi:hypothetical protein
MQGVSGSYLSPHIGYPGGVVSGFSQFLPAHAGVVTQAVAKPSPAKALFRNCCVIQSFIIQAFDNMVN